MARRMVEGCGRASCFAVSTSGLKGPDFLSLKTYFAKQSCFHHGIPVVQPVHLARRRTWCAHTTCIYIQYSRQYP